MLKKIASVILAVVMLLSFAAEASAAGEKDDLKWVDVYTYSSAENQNSKVSMQRSGGMNYLFLPSTLSVQSVPLYFNLNKMPDSVSIVSERSEATITSGQCINLAELFGEKNEYSVSLIAKLGEQEKELALSIIPTDGIGSMFLISDDPVNHGRKWVESSPDKTNQATGKMFMQDADGAVIYDDTLTQIKGRGNSTWQTDKKPYQIKLGTKTDLLKTGSSENKSKTWVLLANAFDPTLLRNNIVFDFSVAIGMQPGIECQPLNLFYDGEYRGAYLLCEKVEVSPGRVDIFDLESANEKKNPTISDYNSLTVDSAKTANGAIYTFCTGMNNPTNITGGYLLEMDAEYRAKAEKCYFRTTRNQYIVVKSPEYCTKEEMNYIASYYQEFENTLFNKGVNPNNKKSISNYVDMDSFVNCYLINEFSKNPDGFFSSSYIYKEARSNIMTFGPIWDYDLSFGIGSPGNMEATQRSDGLFTIFTQIGKAAYEIPEFRQKVHDTYLSKFAPLISDILVSGGKKDTSLQSFDAYQAEIHTAAYADGIIWGRNDEREERNNSLLTFISERSKWLSNEFSTWDADICKRLGSFADVSPNEWYFNDVADATSYGFINGITEVTYAPNDNTTRAQTAKVLFEIAGAERVAFSPVFSDVTNDAWYAPAVMWAVRNQVVLGYNDKTFRPDNQISRQDFIVLLYRYLQSPKATEDKLDDFNDASEISSYARDALKWAVEVNLLRGYENNTIRPTGNVTRAELAALIVRFYEGFIKQ